LLPLIFVIETGWYTVVAMLFSSAPPRAAYLRWKAWIDRLAAGIIGALGIKLISDAARSH
jgi:threonine/homoserine/homoserine lactone efflux protein